MKPLWISSLILATMFAILLYNAQHLKQLIDPLHDQLTQAGEFVKADDRHTAFQLTQEVHDTLHKQNTYLHITLPHSNIDEIYMLLEECMAYLEDGKIGEYNAANQCLLNQLKMLYEMETLTLTNIL